MYSISSFTINLEDLVYTCQWSYSNEDGSVSGEHSFAIPEEGADITPLSEVTEEMLISWLLSQLSNTTEEFEAHITKTKIANEKKESLEVRTFDTLDIPEPAEEKEEEEEEEEV